jgi:hypothetical protein
MLLELLAATGLAARRRRRPVDDPVPYTVDRPGIELSGVYGGWDAEAYDAGTGHDRSWACRLPATPWDAFRR